MRRRILTWHVHGSYLYNLVQAPHDFFVPVREGRPEGYGGRSGNFPWPENLHDVPAEQVRDLNVDLILYQSTKNYLVDQFEILSPEQRELPRIYLEHNSPRPSPTDSRHPIDDPHTLLVHCTYYNAMMWDNGRAPTTVIPHGVFIQPDLQWDGQTERGITVVNGLARRGRLTGCDVFLRMRQEAPLDLAGMDSERFGGLGDLPLQELHRREAAYRFFFNPIRYTSLPLAVVEAMTIGLPIVALATTELPRAVPTSDVGYISNDPAELADGMWRLLLDPAHARRLSERARSVARQLFGIDRFVRDWSAAFERVCTGG